MARPRAGRRLPSILQSRYVLWLALALPAGVQTFRYWQGTVFYGEYLHWTGELAARILIVTLAITPLRLAFPRAQWVLWLLARRRYLGVATFGYSLLHATAYLGRETGFRPIVEDALALPIGSGWIALAIFLLLAATSNDASVRVLRRGWKLLHRTVYVAAALTFAHWILTAFDPLAGAIHAGVLVALQAFRVWKTRSMRRSRQRAHPSGDTG